MKAVKLSWREWIVCALSAAVFPTAFYMYFCAQNVNELKGWFILLSGVLIALLGFILYCVSSIVTRNGVRSLAFCEVVWGGCFLSPSILSVMNMIITKMGKDFSKIHGRLLITSTLIFVVAVAVVLLVWKFPKLKFAINIVTSIAIIIMIYNSIIVARGVMIGVMYSEEWEAVKTDYSVNNERPSPNVYWVHADGMLGFDAFEKYYGDSQDEFTAALNERGFDIARDAQFEAAHTTQAAIPILTCPYAYDTWISKFTGDHETAKLMLDRGNLKKLAELRHHAEMQTAFDEKGYTVDVIGFFGYYYPPEGGYMWPTGSDLHGVLEYSSTQDFVLELRNQLTNIEKINEYFKVATELVTKWIGSPLRYSKLMDYNVEITDADLERILLKSAHLEHEAVEMIPCLYDVLYGEHHDQPRLTIIHDIIPHRPFAFDENGTFGKESEDPLDYYEQHIYSAKVLVEMVDLILEADPDAVIVLQSDHGLHGNKEKDFIAAFGDSADTIELWNSTMSAIRIPEKYRSGEEGHLMDTPLNISRYLVNNFVGYNYQYLESQ